MLQIIKKVAKFNTIIAKLRTPGKAYPNIIFTILPHAPVKRGKIYFSRVIKIVSCTISSWRIRIPILKYFENIAKAKMKYKLMLMDTI